MSHVLGCVTRHVIMNVPSPVRPPVGVDVVMPVHLPVVMYVQDVPLCVTLPARPSVKTLLGTLV